MSSGNLAALAPLEKRITLTRTFGRWGSWGKDLAYPGPPGPSGPLQFSLTTPRGTKMVDVQATYGMPGSQYYPALRWPPDAPAPFLELDLTDVSMHSSAEPTLANGRFGLLDGARPAAPEDFPILELEDTTSTQTGTEAVSDRLTVMSRSSVLTRKGFSFRVLAYQYLVGTPFGTLVATWWIYDEPMMRPHGRKILDAIMGTAALTPAGPR